MTHSKKTTNRFVTAGKNDKFVTCWKWNSNTFHL